MNTCSLPVTSPKPCSLSRLFRDQNSSSCKSPNLIFSPVSNIVSTIIIFFLHLHSCGPFLATLLRSLMSSSCPFLHHPPWTQSLRICQMNPSLILHSKSLTKEVKVRHRSWMWLEDPIWISNCSCLQAHCILLFPLNPAEQPPFCVWHTPCFFVPEDATQWSSLFEDHVIPVFLVYS